MSSGAAGRNQTFDLSLTKGMHYHCATAAVKVALASGIDPEL